jgi:hypothetical protein
MSTALLLELRQRGFSLSHENGCLRISPASKIDDALRSRVRARKTELLACLRTEGQNSVQSVQSVQAFDLDDLCETFAERAAIMQFEGGLSREEAEKQALGEVLQRLRRQTRP